MRAPSALPLSALPALLLLAASLSAKALVQDVDSADLGPEIGSDSSESGMGSEETEASGEGGQKGAALNAQGCGVSHAGRIINGDEAPPDSWPWQATLLNAEPDNRWTFFCGGAMITEEHVLTAAHCLVDNEGAPTRPDQMRVRIGNQRFEGHKTRARPGDRQVDWIKPHEAFARKPTHKNDIAIVHLRPLPAKQGRPKTVCLPSDSADDFVDSEAIVTGHGLTNGTDNGSASLALLEASLEIYKSERCEQRFRRLEASHICAGNDEGRSSCRGDSGGPLMVRGENYVLVGLVSYGPKACDEGFGPTVFTRTSSFLKWIKRNLRGP